MPELNFHEVSKTESPEKHPKNHLYEIYLETIQYSLADGPLHLKYSQKSSFAAIKDNSIWLIAKGTRVTVSETIEVDEFCTIDILFLK